MDELLKEFWEAWKVQHRYHLDLVSYPSSDAFERNRMRCKVNRLAQRLMDAERAKPASAPSDDVPGQLYFDDLGRPLPVPVAMEKVA